MKSEDRYSLLNEDEPEPFGDDTGEPLHATKPTFIRNPYVLYGVASSGWILAIISLVLFIHLHFFSHKSSVHSLHCGSSPAEARSLGCQYDVMIGSWLPSPCYDAELMEEYLKEASFKWYSDPEFQHEIPIETMRLGDHGKVYTTEQEHTLHCSYVWVKQMRAVINKKPMDDLSARYNHTRHCAGTIVNPVAKDEVIFGVVRYGTCVSFDEKRGVPHGSSSY